MKNCFNVLVSLWLIASFCACQSAPEYCTVKGTVKGIKDGTKLELQDAYDHFKVIETVRVKDGAFEFHPRISAPTHVYLYSSHGDQLKDFILEPGTIVADLDATDEDDMGTGAVGTPSNDILRETRLLYLKEEDALALRRWKEIIDAGENGILALYYADHIAPSAVEALAVLDRLDPEFSSRSFIAGLRDELTRRSRTERAPEGAVNYYIDMEFPDVDGKLISLSSVVNDPANRLVLLDFWATWCDPCREAVPAMKALYDRYHGKGLEIYSVSEDPKTREKIWRNYIPENGMTWINVLDTNAGRSDSQVWFDYALYGIPTTILLDGETGAILLRDNLKTVEAKIASLLE